MMPGDGRTAILLAAPGSSCPEALEVYERLREAAGRSFPGIPCRWTFTSSGIRRKLAQGGRPVPSPHEALSALQLEGLTRAAVVPLHLADGMEYRELAETVTAFRKGRGPLTQLSLGLPLLADEDEWRQTVMALRTALAPGREPGDAVVMVAHGSLEERTAPCYRRAAGLCQQVDPRLFMGMILGSPDQGEVIAACQAAGVVTVRLLPAMVAAGFSARGEIGGPGPESWRSALEAAGFRCAPVPGGLGDFEGVVSVWMERCRRLLTERETSHEK